MSARICFGYKTALQLLRTAKPGELSSATARQRKLPARAPYAHDLQSTLERMEATHPALRFEKPVHILVNTSDYRASDICKPYLCTASLPAASLLRSENDTILSAPELAFAHMATQAESEAALLKLGWEMCGSYQGKRTGAKKAYNVKPLTSTRAMRCFVSKNPSLHGARKVARVLPYLADGSASPRESQFALVLGLPMMKGGHGLGIPRMNFEVIANREARAISGRKSFRCDLCWPEAKVDVEYQSRENHEGEVSRIRDSRRTNALIAMGWTVISVTNDELDSLIATDTIAQSIRRKLGKRLQTRISDHHARKLKLRRQLGLPIGYD